MQKVVVFGSRKVARNGNAGSLRLSIPEAWTQSQGLNDGGLVLVSVDSKGRLIVEGQQNG